MLQSRTTAYPTAHHARPSPPLQVVPTKGPAHSPAPEAAPSWVSHSAPRPPSAAYPDPTGRADCSPSDVHALLDPDELLCNSTYEARLE